MWITFETDVTMARAGIRLVRSRQPAPNLARSLRNFVCNRSASAEPREGIKASVAIQAAVRQYTNNS
jgi:hypothetical protein